MRVMRFVSLVLNFQRVAWSNCKHNLCISWRFLIIKPCTLPFVTLNHPSYSLKGIYRLEAELRNFATLTQGDIIEIWYNSIVFGILVMETSPGGGGIDILDTDLSVDFAAPVGYVEPEKPKAAPPPTMASRLKIDLDSTSPGSSRPGSSLSGGFTGGQNAVSKDGDAWESFKGKGETLAGRKTKGKGITHRKVEQVAEDSKIIRTK